MCGVYKLSSDSSIKGNGFFGIGFALHDDRGKVYGAGFD